MDKEKTWATRKSYFKEIYRKHKWYNKVTKKTRIKKRSECEGENIVSEDSIREKFEELINTYRVYQEHIQQI